jgi:hypothetical protein
MPMRRLLLAMPSMIAPAAILSAALFSAAALAQPVGWQKYVVPQTGAAVDLPNEIFSEDAGEPDKGYGHRFRTKDGRANLIVQSLRNDERDSPRSFLRKHFNLPESAALYRRVGSEFFAVSGFHDRNIWYDRCNFAGSYIHCVALNYPASEKRHWDYVVTQISNTLTKR